MWKRGERKRGERARKGRGRGKWKIWKERKEEKRKRREVERERWVKRSKQDYKVRDICYSYKAFLLFDTACGNICA